MIYPSYKKKGALIDLYCFVLILFSSFDKIQVEGSLVPWAPLPSDISQDDYGAVLRVEPTTILP